MDDVVYSLCNSITTEFEHEDWARLDQSTLTVPRRKMRCLHCNFYTTDLDGDCPTCGGRFLRPHYPGRATTEVNESSARSDMSDTSSETRGWAWDLFLDDSVDFVGKSRQEHSQRQIEGQTYQGRRSEDSRPARFIALHPSVCGGWCSEDYWDQFATGSRPSTNPDVREALVDTTSTAPRRLPAVFFQNNEASVSSPASTRYDSRTLYTLLSDPQRCCEWIDHNCGEENIDDEGIGRAGEEDRGSEEEDEGEEADSDICSIFQL